MSGVLREPIVHFAIIAVLIFVYFGVVSGAAPMSDDGKSITVSENQILRSATQFQTARNRPATRQELESLMDWWTREEIMVREARALGLDRNDVVIRDRLRQKMEFLTSSAAQGMTPDEAVLQTYFETNKGTYEIAGRIAFEQVFLGETVDQAAVETTLAELNNGGDPTLSGEPTLLPYSVPLSLPVQVDGGFGSGFFDRVSTSDTARWTGPVQSAYGWHLVRLTDQTPPGLPNLSEIRDTVLANWRRAQAEHLLDAQFELMLARYDVTFPEGDWTGRALAK
ncbi:MAG: peptidylprolyl isomerase [Pseudomonadota bacterium]